VEHCNVYQLVRWAEAAYSPAELSRVLFGMTVSFDMAVFEIFLPLCLWGAGGLAENTLQLPELPAKDEGTMPLSVPSLADALLRIATLPASLQTVNLGGEALSASLVKQVYDSGQVLRVYNLYGPTETTVTCTLHYVPRGIVEQPSIGRPIAGARLYVLDRQRE